MVSRPDLPVVPLHAPARASVARRARFAGTLPLARLPRLTAILAASDGELHVDLQARPDAGGAPHLIGRITGPVQLQCQRCLRPFSHTVDLALDLRLVESEADEERLMHECEPYAVQNDRLPLHEIIEDEVMLALPWSPRCERPDCHPGVAGDG
jgi:uncharacterized protein